MEVDAESRMADMQREGFRYALYNALRYGSKDQFKGVPVRLDSLDDRVQTYRGAPTILRTSRLKTMIERDRLSSFFPHYFDRLAFECALGGRSPGATTTSSDSPKILRQEFAIRMSDTLIASAGSVFLPVANPNQRTDAMPSVLVALAAGEFN